MISEVSRRAICAILAADESATDAERERVAFALRGESRAVIAVADVCKRIGRSRPTVWRLVKRGALVGVKGSGECITGISAESLERYLRGEVA